MTPRLDDAEMQEWLKTASANNAPRIAWASKLILVIIECRLRGEERDVLAASTDVLADAGKILAAERDAALNQIYALTGATKMHAALADALRMERRTLLSRATRAEQEVEARGAVIEVQIRQLTEKDALIQSVGVQERERATRAEQQRDELVAALQNAEEIARAALVKVQK